MSALIDDFDKSLKYYKKRPPFKSPNFYYDEDDDWGDDEDDDWDDDEDDWK